jgi:hypothetical protein
MALDGMQPVPPIYMIARRILICRFWCSCDGGVRRHLLQTAGPVSMAAV